jgi:hypothetical protein
MKMPGSGEISSGAAYRNRTDDLRITRGMLPSRTRPSCTDSTGHGTDDTRHAGIIWRPGPRTGPRSTPLSPTRAVCYMTCPPARFGFFSAQPQRHPNFNDMLKEDRKGRRRSPLVEPRNTNR